LRVRLPGHGRPDTGYRRDRYMLPGQAAIAAFCVAVPVTFSVSVPARIVLMVIGTSNPPATLATHQPRLLQAFSIHLSLTLAGSSPGPQW